MKVCHFVSYSAESHYLVNLGKGLAEKGVSLFCGTLFETGKKTPEWAEMPNVNYFCLNAKSKKDFPKAIWSLSRMLKQENIDILQTHLYEASFVGLLAAKLAKTPYRILTRHHLDQAYMVGKKLPIFLDKWEANDADRVVVLSNAVKEFLVSKDSIDADKITVIHQGFDFDGFIATEEDRKRIRDEFNLTEQEFLVGTIGNFFPTKGHRFLVQALKELLKSIPEIKLFFVGSGGDIDSLKNQISELGLEEKVIFAGFRKDVNACMKAVDIVVHPSLSEAFCQVLIETMSVGTPLISTDVGGAKEVITHNENGMLIPPENVDSIIEAVKRVYLEKDFTRQMALAGQKSVWERFTVEKMVDRQIECYRKLLNSK